MAAAGLLYATFLLKVLSWSVLRPFARRDPGGPLPAPGAHLGLAGRRGRRGGGERRAGRR